MSQKYEKLKSLLKELFQLDQPDLDFGLYRIMHAKAGEVTQFLERDLLPQVKEEFGRYKTADKADIEQQLAKAIEQARALGADPESLPRVKELRAQLGSEAVDIAALEGEVYDHLISFFGRYYSEGDFLSKRRYSRDGRYAIPYDGEEVKLHWANHDQYYIKTSEYLRDYAFRLNPSDEADPMRVHLRIVDAAEGEHGNIKPQNGKERAFILAAADFIGIADGELIIRFEYRPPTIADWPEEQRAGKAKPPAQKDLTEIAEKRIMAQTDADLLPWLGALTKPHVKADGERADYSRLRAHLNRYVARNTFDYFIHKDLGGFLRRELDFYIKNEVMQLDDIENESIPRVEQYLSKIKVVRRIAGKIITFLAQLEDFQRTLWLKKKFVIETHYVIALREIPDEFLPEVVANDEQWAEWESLHHFSEVDWKDELFTKNTKLRSLDFLKAAPSLMIDTRYFDDDFCTRLIERLGDLHDRIDAELFHSENFQALSLMQARYRGKVKCVYIDPPYNTDASPIIYKNGYQRSSWASMMADRLQLDASLRSEQSILVVAIDDFEYPDLQAILEGIAHGHHHATAVVRSKPQGRPTTSGFSANHEYAVFWGADESIIGRLPRTGSKAERYPHSDRKGIYSWANFRKSGTDSDRTDRRRSFYPVFVKAETVRIPQMEWDENQESWQIKEVPSNGEEAIWPIDASSLEKVWTCSPERATDEIDDIRVERDGSGRIEIYKKYRPNQDGALPGTWWDDSQYSASESGTKVLKELFGSKDFDFPKSINLVIDCLRVGNAGPGDVVLDYFAGSGTSGHAVATLNREDGGNRKVILVEQGDYFWTVLLPRLKKIAFTPEWKEGKPKRFASAEELERGPRLFKVIQLESYEDTLNNLDLRRTPTQQSLLDRPESQGGGKLREQYLLSYMLKVEASGSPSLLSVEGFSDPTAYRLVVKRPGSDESREVHVDLIETFNWLLGLTVHHLAAPQSFSAQFERDAEKRLRLKGRLKAQADGPHWFRTVTGTLPDGRKVLVIWRKLTGNPEEDNLVLDEWFTKQNYSSKDSEFDLIFVNGGNNLENLKMPDDTWKVRLIEDDFKRLMFATEGN